MSISLDELLPLVGRLDDAPGFDTPRERFRRFLLNRVSDLPTAGALIDDCQRSVGEQRHRALQDLIVLVGRLLGFSITFGTYGSADDLEAHAHWRSPGLLDVALEIRTEQTATTTLEGLARAVAAAGAAPRDEREAPIGLCVVARQYAAREKLNHLLAASAQFTDLRVVSVRSLLSLAAHVSADRLSHAEVVELLRTGFALDFVIDLLDRPTADRSGDSNVAPELPARASRHDAAFWVATITGDEMIEPGRLLASVIVPRRVLAIGRGSGSHGQGSPGDWVGFFLADKGIVGHAQLASIIEDGACAIRHADRFRCVYRLAHVTLYAQPIVQALRAGRPFAVPPADVPLAGSYLAPIARQDFLALTTYCDGAAIADGSRSATA
jgi:hypothetical protein